jgi:hypothetical protein
VFVSVPIGIGAHASIVARCFGVRVSAPIDWSLPSVEWLERAKGSADQSIGLDGFEADAICWMSGASAPDAS